MKEKYESPVINEITIEEDAILTSTPLGSILWGDGNEDGWTGGSGPSSWGF